MENQKVNRDIIVFGGVNFIRYPDAKRTPDKRYYKGRWRIGGKLVKTYLHRVMWLEANGPIPEGFHIHHKDGNWLNNALDNFECVGASAHISTHYHEQSADWKANKTAILVTVGKEAAKEWHKSEAGRAWHSQHAQANKEKHRRVIACIECGAEAITTCTRLSHFCGDRCRKRSAARTFRAKHREAINAAARAASPRNRAGRDG